MNSQFGQVLDAVYSSVTAPHLWRDALGAMCGLFGCHFGDAFARTTDFGTYRGIAYGLDEDDYQRGMLDGWVKRNVWSAVYPVREAGLVVTTREMVEPSVLKRSDMYAEFLDARDLHEGLRFDLWAGNGWVQDVSLLRPWAAGPFEGGELETARLLLPHLQRAAAVSRQLQEAEAVAVAGFEAVDALRQPLFLTDGHARVLRANAAGERLLREGAVLSTERAVLAGPGPDATGRLRSAVARAAEGEERHSGQLRLRGPKGDALNVLAMPVAGDAGWTGVGGPAVLLMAAQPSAPAPPSLPHLAAVFDLTRSEAEVAFLLAAGRSVAEIAAETRRSINTVRTHVARLMAKTGTHRQVALIRALMQAPPERPEDGGPWFG